MDLGDGENPPTPDGSGAYRWSSSPETPESPAGEPTEDPAPGSLTPPEHAPFAPDESAGASPGFGQAEQDPSDLSTADSGTDEPSGSTYRLIPQAGDGDAVSGNGETTFSGGDAASSDVSPPGESPEDEPAAAEPTPAAAGMATEAAPSSRTKPPVGVFSLGVLLGLALAAALVWLGSQFGDDSPAATTPAGVVEVAVTAVPSDADSRSSNASGTSENGGASSSSTGTTGNATTDAADAPNPPSRPLTNAEIAQITRPSVVHVIADPTGGVNDLIPAGGGSGVVITDEGHIITNDHVIEDGETFTVITPDGDQLSATLIGTDPLTDIAVLQADPTPRFSVNPSPVTFHPAKIGSTEDLLQGDPAIAVGYPSAILGESTVSVGVVSARNRVLQTDSANRLYDLVQTDAEISPGSSGGGLFNQSGELIGITTLLRVTQVGAAGLGFAIPVEIAANTAFDIIETGAARHGWIGISGHTASAEITERCDYDNAVLVAGVTPNGPADDAGLEADDLLVAIDDRPLNSMESLVADIRLLNPDDEVVVQVCRDGEVLSFDLVVGLRDPNLS